MKCLQITVFTCLLAGASWASSQTAGADALVPADHAQPTWCGTYFSHDATTGTCLVVTELVDKLGPEACEQAGFRVQQLVGGGQRCDKTSQPPPAPACKPLAGYGAKVEAGQCRYTTQQPRTSRGDYEGDCFRVKAVPAGSGLQGGEVLVVTRQQVQGEDKLLDVVQGTVSFWPLPWTFGCKAWENGSKRQIQASTLNEHGASRYGWAYGALVMPYKYYRHTRTFVAGVPIGAYLGWRYGRVGSGVTIAAAFTLSQVEAQTLDPVNKDDDGAPLVTGSVQTGALSGALGLVFDVTKSAANRPFKAGFFVGQDRVNVGPTLRYENNRKTWVAFQLGYDFTDN